MLIRDRINKKNSNKGFTLVELIVVLILMTILLSVAIFGGLAWQDWSRFQHEDSVAEEIFFAAQNQLIEFDSSGAMERNVIRVIRDGDGYQNKYVVAYSYKGNDGSINLSERITLAKIKDDTYSTGYAWNTIWANNDESAEAIGLNTNLSKETRSIITLSAKTGDYADYLKIKAGDNSVSLDEGTILLFDLVAPYISDTATLNGSIVLEFSPENGQVFSVCYSDSAEELVYEFDSSVAAGKVGIYDRTTYAREKKMLGYYSVGQLTEKIKGKGEDITRATLKILNKETLSLVVHDNENSLGENSKLDFVLYDGDSDSNNTKAMAFTIKYSDLSGKDSITKAIENPLRVKVSFYEGKYKNYTDSDNLYFRFPAWIDENGDIIIILDGADVQAGTSVYSSVKLAENIDPDDEKARMFRNTFSFYRFGLSEEVNYVYASVAIYDGDDSGSVTPSYSVRDLGTITGENPLGYKSHTEIFESEGGHCGECTTFGTYDLSEEDVKEFSIENARHLYNVRYETEYKKETDKKNEFTLSADIDWKEFVGNSESGINYYLNSYDKVSNNDDIQKFGNSGIAYKGNVKIAGVDGDADTIFVDTAEFPFPSFRCLGRGDIFTQALAYGESDPDDAEARNYVISNLTISFGANVVYGIYDDVIADTTTYGNTNDSENKGAAGGAIKNNCLAGDFNGLIGLINSNAIDSSGSSLTRGGAMPLGLFCENLGVISNITLNKHVVRGIEPDISENTTPAKLICTNMVGGFTGNNIGYVSKLTLLDNVSNSADSNKANITKVNGRTDVGGIIGRESFVVPDQNAVDKLYGMDTAGNPRDSRDVIVTGMKNYGTVTGMENIGGIVGRAYTHYVGEEGRNHNYTEFTVFTPQRNVFMNEQKNPRYKYYHDGYYITDNDLSMTGVTVNRVREITIENSINRGKVSGDDVFYDSVNKTKCAFIGGIAGITMDGYILDGSNNLYTGSSVSVTTDNSNFFPIKLYASDGYFAGSFAYVKVKNCNSFYVGNESNILSDSDIAQDIIAKTDYRALNRDYYVGGIVGYARLTAFENINAKPASDKTFTSGNYSGASRTVVMGAGYVGGLIGCADLTRFDKGDVQNSDGRTYYASNYNNVIGKKYVGGIAGAFGIGSNDQEKLSFRNPSANNGTQPSSYYGNDAENGEGYITGRKLLNNAVVLSVYNWNPFNYHDNENDRDNYLYSVNDTGACGGIAGATRSAIYDCDNIQSQSVKNLAMRMISGGDNNLYSLGAENIVKTISDSKRYGGCGVGGIVGMALETGMINPAQTGTDGKCYVDAIVCGNEKVGGFVGYGDSGLYTCRNLYPSKTGANGLLVIGTDSVGGFYGECNSGIVNSDSVSEPFIVKGRYAVGAIVGRSNDNDGADSETYTIPISIDSGKASIDVEGIAYVGGLMGLSENLTKEVKLTNQLSKMNIYGKYFVGGYYGATVFNSGTTVDSDVQNQLNRYVSKTYYAGINDNVMISADAFAGGMIGLLDIYNDGYTSFDVCANNVKTGTLQQLITNRTYNGSAYADYKGAFSAIVNNDISNAGVEDQTVFRKTKLSNNADSYRFNFTYENDDEVTRFAEVKAEIFAGGIFGYVPNGLAITVEGLRNGTGIRTTGYVGGNSGAAVNESYDGNVKYSYLGAVVGRVPTGMILKNCSNKVSGIYADDRSEYYYSSDASYLGGLTEVNAGIITGDGVVGEGETATINRLVNETDFDYEDFGGSVGAFAGVNGTKFTNGKSSNEAETVSSGVIVYCENDAEISAANAAGIAASAGGESYIGNCLNKGKIIGTDNPGEDTNKGHSAGILYISHNGISDYVSIKECSNIGPLSGGSKRAGIAYDTKGYGDIQRCSNYGAGATNGITCTPAYIMTKNLEASGLSEGDGAQPIGPDAVNMSEQTRNFYIFGSAKENEEVIHNIEKEKIGFKVESTSLLISYVTSDVSAKYCSQNESSSPIINSVNKGFVTSTDWFLEFTPQNENGDASVNMESIKFVWKNDDFVTGFINSNFVGNYKVEVTYETENGEIKSETYNLNFNFYGNGSDENEIDFTKSLKVRKIKLSAYGKDQDHVGVFYFLYQYMKWRDASGAEHYITCTDHPIEIDPYQGNVFFTADLNNSTKDAAFIYNQNLNPDRKDNWILDDYSTYELNIDTTRPEKGIPMKGLKLYWGNETGNEKVLYTVRAEYLNEDGTDGTYEQDCELTLNPGSSGPTEQIITFDDTYNVTSVKVIVKGEDYIGTGIESPKAVLKNVKWIDVNSAEHWFVDKEHCESVPVSEDGAPEDLAILSNEDLIAERENKNVNIYFSEISTDEQGKDAFVISGERPSKSFIYSVYGDDDGFIGLNVDALKVNALFDNGNMENAVIPYTVRYQLEYEDGNVDTGSAKVINPDPLAEGIVECPILIDVDAGKIIKRVSFEFNYEDIEEEVDSLTISVKSFEWIDNENVTRGFNSQAEPQVVKSICEVKTEQEDSETQQAEDMARDDLSDTHWPKQLFVGTYDNGEVEYYGFLYIKDGKYNELDPAQKLSSRYFVNNPISEDFYNDRNLTEGYRESVYEKINPIFLEMVDNETDFANDMFVSD